MYFPEPHSFADEHRALSFVYVVKEDDETAHFKHAGSDTLELYNNATIKRASTKPTTDALISLPVSEGGGFVLARGSCDSRCRNCCAISCKGTPERLHDFTGYGKRCEHFPQPPLLFPGVGCCGLRCDFRTFEALSCVSLRVKTTLSVLRFAPLPPNTKSLPCSAEGRLDAPSAGMRAAAAPILAPNNFEIFSYFDTIL